MATTKSGLMIDTIDFEHDGVRQTLAQEHTWLVRFTHWLNAISLVVMTMSGLQIYMAFPSFGAKIPQENFVHIPEAMRLGGWLGGALQWHLTFAWIFTLTGVAYVLYLIVALVDGGAARLVRFLFDADGWKRDPDYLAKN